LRDDDNNVGSGGAVMFGAHTGFHAAIKSSLEDGSNNTRGHLSFFVRAAHGDSTMAHVMTLADGGSVGIGTTNPAVKLQVGANNETAPQYLWIRGNRINEAGDISGIHFYNSVNSGDRGNSRIINSRGTDNYASSLQFWTNPAGNTPATQKMVIDQIGFVGIGTAAPGQKLSIYTGSTTVAGLSINRHPNGHYRTEFYQADSGLAIHVGDDSTAPTEKMRIVHTGKVGIATAAPAALLHVYGPGSSHGLIARIGGYDGVLDIGTLPTTYGAETIYMQTRIDGGTGYTGERQVMALQPDAGGRVGIGTTQPHTPLHVQGTVSKTHNNGRYFNSNEGVVALSTRSRSVSIFATGDIMSTSGFLASSDRRIKKDIIDVNDSEALDTLRLLKPKTYKYKDSAERGKEPVWGFIAQDVSNVISNSIRLVEETIPNIYELADVSESNVITLNTFNTSDLEANTNTIRIIHVNGTTHDATITSVIDEHTIRVDENLNNWSGSVDAYGNVITETTTTTLSVEEYEALENKGGYVRNISGYQSANVMISVEEYEALGDTSGYTEVVENYTENVTTYPGNKLFVYGQRITDFHSLNKSAIWTVATAALQEVDRQLQDTKAQLASVLTRLDALESA